MVHGELIRTGQVQKLTYKQVRHLENIDRRRAREEKYLEIFKASIEAGGRAAQGIFQGTITGPIALVLLLTATYPAWLPPVTSAAGALAGAIGNAWHSGIGPVPGGGQGAPPAPPLDHFDGGQGNFGVHWEPQLWVTIVISLGGIPTAGGTQWYQTAAERDAALAADNADGSKNWYWSFSAVNR
jgi:hypothetical protein